VVSLSPQEPRFCSGGLQTAIVCWREIDDALKCVATKANTKPQLVGWSYSIPREHSS
jgi:hypothetical protein